MFNFLEPAVVGLFGILDLTVSTVPIVLGRRVKTSSIETHLNSACAQARTSFYRDLDHVPTAGDAVIEILK